MSGVTPQSTTSNLAGNVPKESSRDLERMGSSDLPGSFPETPAAERSEFAVNPIPASMGIGNPVRVQPGEKVPDPSTFTSNTVSSTVRDDLSLAKDDEGSQQTFGVNPLPATSGAGNPIHLKPGEKVPRPGEFTSNKINSAVTTDRESYENSSGAPQLPDVVTPQKERDARGGGMFNLPGLSDNMIPESSLPMGEGTPAERDPGFTIQSAGPHTTTAELAGKVPLEPRGVPDKGTSTEREHNFAIHSAGPHTTTAELAGKVPLEQRGVPEIVQESQAKAGLDPEASANQEAVREKSQMEKELESKVPEEPPTAEGTGMEDGGPTEKKETSGGVFAGIAAGGAGMVTAVAAAAGFATKEKSPEQSTSLFSRVLPTSVQQAIDEMNKGTAIAPTVPDVVQDSITKARQSPEAATSEEMVGEKSAMETEFMQQAKTEEAGSEATNKGIPIASTVPDIVQKSISKAHQSPEAAASEEMVGEKSAMESEFLQHVKTEDGGLGAANRGIPIASTVPDVVQKSIAKSHQSPEAAASEAMVGEKSMMEAEFLKQVKTEEAGVDKMNKGIAIAPTVPDVVQESIAKAHQSPEAAASVEMVGEKSAMEVEFLQHVKTEEAVGEPAPSMSAALSESAPAPTMMPSERGLNAPAPTLMSPEPSSDAPGTTLMSPDKGLDAPAAIPTSSGRDLDPTSSSSMLSGPGLAAPAAAPATTSAAKNSIGQVVDSRDVSPMSRGPTTTSQAQPSVTTGLGSSAAPQVSQADSPVIQKKMEEPKAAVPAKASPMSNKSGESSAGASADKKSKRASGFFGKLKQKFHHKD